MIDKQFVVRLKDSRKTIKLILVSPRRIPEFDPPDFDDEFDLEKLEVLIPFGGATGGMLIVLLLILMYGYMTRPQDRYQRDRDNELHFRHLLFVVWFVVMRLLKSFLLTLTVIFVILTAIHHTNVTTLKQYKAFHRHQKSLEEDFLKQMDAHRVQEINRQWGMLGQGKLKCDQKLKELNTYLDAHFKEIKERQEDEMRRKNIVLAASQRIEAQLHASRTRLERERNRLNQQLKFYSHEINSRVSKIQVNIEDNFWLKAAKGMHKALSEIAAFFGGSMKPFLQWVGLSVNFQSINVEMPSFDDILGNVNLKMDSLNLSHSNSSSPFWKQQVVTDTKVKIQEISMLQLNISSPLNKQRTKELLALEWVIKLYESGLFTTVLFLLDTLWFVYRHTKTYQLAVVLIHGFPKVYELEKIRQEGEDKEEKMRKKELKLRGKAEREIREKNDKVTAINSDANSINNLQESSANELETEQSEERKFREKTRNNSKYKPLEVQALTEEKSGDCQVLENDAHKMGDLGGDVCERELKPSWVKNAIVKKTGSIKCTETGNSSQTRKVNDEDSDELRGIGGTNTTEDPKRDHLIGRGLKRFDAVNTIFFKFLVKLKELNYQVRFDIFCFYFFVPFFVNCCTSPL